CHVNLRLADGLDERSAEREATRDGHAERAAGAVRRGAWPARACEMLRAIRASEHVDGLALGVPALHERRYAEASDAGFGERQRVGRVALGQEPRFDEVRREERGARRELSPKRVERLAALEERATRA